MRKLQDAIRKLSERIRRMERENPSSIGNIRQEKATKTNLEYQELELKSVIRKLDEEIARLTAQYHKLAA